jgi:hypothetical protein
VSIFGNIDYVVWRRQRLDALTRLHGSGFLRGLRVLELGGGDGHMTVELLREGADAVVMVEGRAEYAAAARNRSPGVRVCHHDCDTPLLDKFPDIIDERLDLVLHLGLLYHLGDPVRSIHEACSLAPWVILETEVVDSFDPDHRLEHREEPGKEDDGVGPVGVRLSPAGIERELEAAGFSFERVPVDYDPVSGHRYDWSPKGEGFWKPAVTRLMWSARRR